MPEPHRKLELSWKYFNRTSPCSFARGDGDFRVLDDAAMCFTLNAAHAFDVIAAAVSGLHLSNIEK